MRIVSLSPAATETVFAVGKGSSIVAVDQFSNFPEDAKKVVHLADHQRVSIAAIREHAPDLVLTGTIIQERLAQELKDAGLPVFHQDPRTLDAVMQSIIDLGIVIEAEEEAQALVMQMKEDARQLHTKAKLLPRKAKVYIEEWHLPPMVSGNWVPEVLSMAGAQSFPIKPGELSREVSLKEVQAFDPDVMVISWCGAGRTADKKILMEREGWDSLRAVQNKHVFVIDDSLLNRPGPRLTEGARQVFTFIFQVLHG